MSVCTYFKGTVTGYGQITEIHDHVLCEFFRRRHGITAHIKGKAVIPAVRNLEMFGNARDIRRENHGGVYRESVFNNPPQFCFAGNRNGCLSA